MALDVFLYLVHPEELQNFEGDAPASFTDVSRCSATIDYLIDKYVRLNNISAGEAMIWRGGTAHSFSEDQAGETAVYKSDEIANVSRVLQQIEAEALMAMYDYEELVADAVYKATRPERIGFLEQTYRQLKDFFARADAEQLFIVKQIV